ncbi:hypothetical protein H9W91_00005 [Streptomyces alfalfae]|uniref:hypothetical protein n=1 Tax=Streptomyces alfalfae TaxID=1642299 RepID=UPI001BA7716F|nr:hypothetical protein [Streptomyces alfalfae]QUI29457.1 hypothetical protein H9W91_00005 [Streptomyces alfalfae]
MSTLALLVVLLLTLMTLVIVGAVSYVVHHRPALSHAVTAGLATLASMATVIGVVISAGGR